MLKNEVKIVLLFVILLFVMKFVNSASVIYNYNSNGVDVFIYPCSNPQCNILSSTLPLNTPTHTSGNTITITIEPIKNNLEYHFSSGYLPKEINRENVNYIGTWPVSFSKQSSCASQLSNIQITGTLQINNPLTITASSATPFISLYHPTNFIPSGYEDYYNAITNIKFYKKGPTDADYILQNTLAGEKIPLIGKSFSFTYTPPVTGDYTFKITTDVTDVKCSSYNGQYIEKTVTVSTSQPTCPTCSPPSAWSSCINSQQNRTNYKCDSTTNYQCQSYTETQSCSQCSDTYDNDNDNKIDLQDPGCSSLTDNDETDLEECPQTGQTCPNKAYEKCKTGHPKCSCTGINDLKAYLCTPQETCPGTTLIHSDPALGTCCSIPCIKAKDPCTEENKKQLCAPDEDGCIMQKTCKNGFWTDCEKADISCQIGETCIDGTPSGTCSNQTTGKLCFDGTLANDASCLGCKEEWYCETWTDCINDYKYCISGYTDLNNCGTSITKRETKQPCSYENPITEEEYQARLKSAEGELGSSEGFLSTKEEQADIKSTLNQLLSIPKSFSVKLGFETPFILLIIAIFLIIIFMHYHKPKTPQKKKSIKKKEETKKVKVNDLLLSVIESLTGDERKVVDNLIEIEGARVDVLREKVGINKTKMDIALQKLEKRQIIKERTDDNSKIFFNEWLK